MSTSALATALEYAPIIARVHSHHPELARTRDLTEAVATAEPDADLAPLFAELRTLTNDYKAPADTCETVEATYRALASVEAEYAGR